MADLQLPLPWVSAQGREIDGLVLRRGPRGVLTHDDGVTVEVRVVEPSRFTSIDEVIDEANRDPGPGQATLVAGELPLVWRARLRAEQVSFVDVSGAVELTWPRIRVRVRAGQNGQPVRRHRGRLPLQKTHARVAQTILIEALAGRRSTVGELAKLAQTDMSSASRTISQLASQGLVSKQREGKEVRIDVPDPAAVADLLAARTALNAHHVFRGWVRNYSACDRASVLSARAQTLGIELAVTGRVGAVFLGARGATSPRVVHCWVSDHIALTRIAGQLDVRPCLPQAANVVLAVNRWRIGLYQAEDGQFGKLTARIAHPLRVWCDLHAEQPDEELADDLWAEKIQAG